MGFTALLDHLANLLLPALVVGPLLALFARILRQPGAARHAWWQQSAINAVAGIFALVGGLVYFGHDGKMETYAAMVLLCATAQFVTTRGWQGTHRRGR